MSAFGARLGGLGLRLHVLVRGQHHDHVAAVLLGRRLHEAELGDVVGKLLQQPEAELRPGLLAAAEHDRDLDLVARRQEARHVTLLGLVVVLVDLGAQLLFLDDGQLLVPTRLAGLLRALVLELAEVHELAHRRAGLRRDLDEVEVVLLRQAQRILDPDDADLFAGGSDETDLRHPDSVVDACLGADGASLVRGMFPVLVRPGAHIAKAPTPFGARGPLCFRSHPAAKPGTSPWTSRPGETGPGRLYGDAGGSGAPLAAPDRSEAGRSWKGTRRVGTTFATAPVFPGSTPP